MFETLLGQEYVKRTLTDALAAGRVGHAYLFCGPAGIGRKSFAAEFGRAVMCTAPVEGGEPCGQCLSCRLTAAGNNPDYKVISGEEGKTGIGVETVRALEEDIVTAPTAGRRKIYDDAESEACRGRPDLYDRHLCLAAYHGPVGSAGFPVRLLQF